MLSNFPKKTRTRNDNFKTTNLRPGHRICDEQLCSSGNISSSWGDWLYICHLFNSDPISGWLYIDTPTHGIWIETTPEAGFPADKVADCNSTMLLSAEGAPIAYRSVCTASDIDGDTFIGSIAATKPDFSDCAWSMHGGTGKYAGVTGGGQCQPLGPISKDGNDSKSTWTGKWNLP